MSTQKLHDFIRISPGFKAAVNLKNDRDNLGKVAGFIPTAVAREILLDFAKTLHPANGSRSRIIMGTYGTGKSHLALVLLNFFVHSPETAELTAVLDKLEPETQTVLSGYRKQIPEKFLIVNLYGDEGDIADSLMMGLRRALEAEGLVSLLPASAFDAALARIEEIEKKYPEHFAQLKTGAEKNGMPVEELKTRLREYQKSAFDLFRQLHPAFSAGSRFEYTTMLTPQEFYTSVVKELREQHGFGGIAVFWDEFGHKMGEVVKDPSGREGLMLQEFAECCNSSESNQLHLYLFCHRSLKEYHDVSLSTLGSGNHQLEDDLRKIEGRFKQYTMKSTDVETFQLISGVVLTEPDSEGWNNLTTEYSAYFDTLTRKTAALRYFVGFSQEELKGTVIFGTYPLHPMAVYNLPVLSEKVAQNNRTLFTCLCEDEPGSFYRYLQQTALEPDAVSPPMFTVDRLWDYFSDDVRQQETTNAVYRNFEHLKTRLETDDLLGLRTLKAVSVFTVTNQARVKMTEDTLAYSLDIPSNKREDFRKELGRLSDLKSEQHILMQLQADGTYRLAVSSTTEPLVEKVRKLLRDTPEKLVQGPIQYLKSLWDTFQVSKSYEATAYGDDLGISRQLMIEPISINQLKEKLHILTKNIGTGTYVDGILLAVLCASSREIDEARDIALTTLADPQYQQLVLAVPKEPVQLAMLLKEHQALAYLKKHEASLYAEGGELHEEWRVWNEDKSSQLTDTVNELFAPERQMLDYFWLGNPEQVMNDRQMRRLTSAVMYKVFPDCPKIREPKLALDDFGGNWGYRKDCRDIVQKLTEKNAAEKLWQETASAQKHVIHQIFKSNGLIRKNQAGEYIIGKPDADAFQGANRTWECIEKYIRRARKQPVEMKNLVRALRRPPFGVKCRSMPLFFAAAAHEELALGNISFEFARTANRIEKITAIESDTLEKVFSAPDKYKLVYVNVSSNQRVLTNALVKLYQVELTPADPALERVKKVGAAVGEWWRALPRYAQHTEQVSEAASILRDHIFQPLAELEPDTEQILLRDAFIHVFDADKKVPQKRIEEVVGPIKEEYEAVLNNLKQQVVTEYSKIFGESSDAPEQSLSDWFCQLAEEKKDYLYSSGPKILVDTCREQSGINEDTLLETAEKLTGLNISSWSDDLVVQFGAKLDAAKDYVDTFSPEPPPKASDPNPPLATLKPSQACLVLTAQETSKQRIFELIDELSPNGSALENVLNSTLEQFGKGLEEKEKTAILYRIIRRHIFGMQS